MNAVAVLEAAQKCEASPTKRQYLTLAAAQEAAVWRTREAKIDIQAYACPSCGYFHLSRTSRLDRVLPTQDGTIMTTGLQYQASRLAKTTPAERVDMSDLIAQESPIVAGNRAAREKLLAEYLEGKEQVTVPEIMDYLQASRYIASNTLHALGWEGIKGQANWYPSGAMPERAPAKPESIARMQRRKKPNNRDALRKSRTRKLKAYLAERTEVTTIEVMELLESGKETAKEMLRDAGWNSGWGPNAKWTPGEDKLAHRRRIVPTQAQLESITVTPREEPVEEPIDLATRRHPAGKGLHDPISSEDGWRPVPSLDALKDKFVSTIEAELAVYGLEMRIEIREKRR
jgi:hypothetical protein